MRFPLLFPVLLAMAHLLPCPSAVAAERQSLMARLWQSEDGLPGNVVRSMVQAADGHLWVATAEGVARFDGTDFEAIEPDGEVRRIRFACWRLFAPEDGSVWVATFQGGLFRIHGDRLERVVEDAPRPRPPLIEQLIRHTDGNYYFRRGTESWKIVEGGNASLVPAPVPAELESAFATDYESAVRGGRAVEPGGRPHLVTRDGRKWETDAMGQLRLDGGKEVALTGVSSPYEVNEMLEDREGNVWIATPVNGLARIRRGRVDVIGAADGVPEGAVFAVRQAGDGAWWIANRSGGIARRTSAGTEHFDLVPSGYQRPVSTLFEDREGRMWIASRGGSVFLRNQDGSFTPQFSRTQIPSKVRAIQQDAAGTLWFGGEQGLVAYDGKTVRHDPAETGFPGGDVTVLVRQGDGILAGTSDGRVFAGGQGGFRALGDASPLRHWWISGLLALTPQEIWATTLGGGLFLWDGREWRQFAGDDGVPDLRLTSILDDGRGHLWFGSLGGVLRASRAELLEKARDPERPLHWLRLDRSDGLPTRECVGGYQPAGWSGDDGKLWFPTGSGIVVVQPELVEVNRVPPPVFLKQTRVNGIQTEQDGEGVVHAGPGRSRVEFRFAGLSYTAPEKVTYRARLRGLDDAWRELGEQRMASYEAVPPGRYTFEVLAVNGDGVWSARPASIALRVMPHFWQTPWFLSAAGLLTVAAAIGIGWILARNRLKRRLQVMKIRHARESERSRIARDLHDDLGASLTEISLLSALAAENTDESTLRPALGQLSDKAKAVVGTLDEIVWAVNPREDTLSSLVDYLAAFAREFLDTAGIPLRTEIPRHVPELPLDATVRHSVFLTAREALNNLVKHSRATEARLAVRILPQTMEIRIEDNGRGFSQEWEAKGYGVANLNERMRSAGGECDIRSIPGEGVTVVLTLPIIATSAPNS